MLHHRQCYSTWTLDVAISLNYCTCKRFCTASLADVATMCGRALGDADYKDPKPFVSAEASIRRLDLLPEDKAVIIASDGLWDVIGDQDVVSMVDHLLQVCSLSNTSFCFCLLMHSQAHCPMAQFQMYPCALCSKGMTGEVSWLTC